MGGMRRVPRDKDLGTWLRGLIKSGREQAFYQTKEWKELRAEVLRDHPLCADCLAKFPAVFSRAQHVHHVIELKARPELALTRWWEDSAGIRHENLVALCHTCHDERHGRVLQGGARTKKEPITEERFD